jgi:hypothetical protein
MGDNNMADWMRSKPPPDAGMRLLIVVMVTLMCMPAIIPIIGLIVVAFN